MTIGWISQYIDGGAVVNGMEGEKQEQISLKSLRYLELGLVVLTGLFLWKRAS
jgi:hypothetical protein